MSHEHHAMHAEIWVAFPLLAHHPSLSIYLSLSLSIYLFISLFIYLSIYLSIYLTMFLSISLLTLCVWLCSASLSPSILPHSLPLLFSLLSCPLCPSSPDFVSELKLFHAHQRPSLVYLIFKYQRYFCNVLQETEWGLLPFTQEEANKAIFCMKSSPAKHQANLGLSSLALMPKCTM